MTDALPGIRRLFAPVAVLLFALLALIAPPSACAQDPPTGSSATGSVPNSPQQPASAEVPKEVPKKLPTADGEIKPAASPIIVIGFVGGYVSHDSPIHSEVKLAGRLSKSYPDETAVTVTVYENRYGEEAHSQILHLLAADHHGTPTEAEKKNARIIIFGHSWGGSETVTLARRLETEGIPVLLTIQVDSVTKRHEEDGTIPANVAEAANFYQLDGVLHGRREIHAEDSAKTQILGNYQFDYKAHPVDCSGSYPWYNRLFMKPHTQIQCDPNVWGKVEALIRSKLPPLPPTPQDGVSSSIGSAAKPSP